VRHLIPRFEQDSARIDSAPAHERTNRFQPKG
jgi:hypothetical protein